MRKLIVTEWMTLDGVVQAPRAHPPRTDRAGSAAGDHDSAPCSELDAEAAPDFVEGGAPLHPSCDCGGARRGRP
jgi:hypothetical protein